MTPYKIDVVIESQSMHNIVIPLKMVIQSIRMVGRFRALPAQE